MLYTGNSGLTKVAMDQPTATKAYKLKKHKIETSNEYVGKLQDRAKKHGDRLYNELTSKGVDHDTALAAAGAREKKWLDDHSIGKKGLEGLEERAVDKDYYKNTRKKLVTGDIDSGSSGIGGWVEKNPIATTAGLGAAGLTAYALMNRGNDDEEKRYADQPQVPQLPLSPQPAF